MIDHRFFEYIKNLPDLSSYHYDSPVGKILLLATGESLLSLIFTGAEDSTKAPFALKNKSPVLSDQINSCIRYLNIYFDSDGPAGKSVKQFNFTSVNRCGYILLLKSGDISLSLDLQGFSEKEISIYQTLSEVDRTISYMELSERAGIIRGARFAGNSMAKNRFPIIIPCHRVIKSDGSLGNYSGGVHIKEFLLRHEMKSRS